MKKKISALFALSAASIVTAFAFPTHYEPKAKATSLDKPNIVFMLIDDLGANDLPVYGNDFNEAPNIEKVAEEGMVFKEYYTQPVCSPSRSCLMSGQNTLRTGITDYLPGRNSITVDWNEYPSLPQVLKDNGYHTGIIGKWHLSAGYNNYPAPGAPTFAGFDDVILSEQKYIADGDYFAPYFHLPQADAPEGKYLIDYMNETAVDYIDEVAKQDEPFMLYFSHYATHTKLDAPDDTVAYFHEKRNTPYSDRGAGNKNLIYTQDRNPWIASMVKHIDDGVGAIDAKLEELGIKDNTILVITSDNGGSEEFTDNGILRGGKHQIYEGGIRDPLIIRYPEKMKEKGTVSDFPATVLDFYQTLSEAAGVPTNLIPKNDGISLLPIIEGTGTPDRDTLHWVLPRYTPLNETDVITTMSPMTEGAAIRVNNYKYLESLAYDNRKELYDLATDPGEQHNLFEEEPTLAQEMRTKLHAEIQKDTMGAKFSANFDPSEALRWANSDGINRIGGKVISNSSKFGLMSHESILRYDAEMETKIRVADNGGRAGLLFRSNMVRPGNEALKAYGVTLDPRRDVVELLNVNSTNASVLASSKVDLEANTDYILKVVTKGENIKAYLDDELVLDANDSTYMFGTFGYISDHASATFDDLKVVGCNTQTPLTDDQLGINETSHVTINGQPLKTASEQVVESNDVFVELNALTRALGIETVKDGENYKLTKFDVTLDITNDGATLNGEAIDLPVKKSDEFLVASKCLATIFGYKTSYDEEKVLIDTRTNYIVSSTSMTTNETNFFDIPNQTSYGSIARRIKGADNFLSYSFYGTKVQLSAMKQPQGGSFKVSIDDEEVASVDTTSPMIINDFTAYESVDMEYGKHTIEISAIDDKPVNINGLKIGGVKVDVPRSDIVTTLVDDRDSNIVYTGKWGKIVNNPAYEGTITRSNKKGDSIEYTFEGEVIRVFIGNGAGAGIMEVYLDNELVDTIDCYNNVTVARVLVFESDKLAAGSHTIKIVHTGEKNALADNSNINFDAFEVISTIPSGEIEYTETKIMCDDASGVLNYVGTWNVINAGTENATKRSNKAGNEVTLTFTGTSIAAYVGGGNGAGMLDVYLDGDLVVDHFDAYLDGSLGAQKLQAYINNDLTNEEHTLTIRVTGEKNPLAKACNINVAYFIVKAPK